MSLQALRLLLHSRLVADIARHRDHARLIVLRPPCPLTTSPLDSDHAQRLIQIARADTDAFLDGGGADRPPIGMRVHRHEPEQSGKSAAALDAHPICAAPNATRTRRVT
jgi:NTE family protein